MEEQKKGLNPKEKRTLMIVSLAIVLALVFGISYAYFLAQDESGTQTITTQNIGLELDDGTEKEPVLLATSIKPIDREDIQTKAVKKNFTVTNTGDEKLFVEITLDDIVLGTDNALKRFDFLWALYEVNGETEKNISIGSFEYVSDTLTVGKYLVLAPQEEKEYNLYIWIEETTLNQNAMMGQTFSAKVVATGEVYWESPVTDFDSSDGTIGYTGDSSDISIPSVINETAITRIGDTAFDMRNLNKVIIPNSVTIIGDYAFSYNLLTNVVIPNSVTSIGSGAFDSNNMLANIIISNSVTSIASNAFTSNQLKSIVIPNNVTTIGGVAFAYNSLTNIIIPNSVTIIGSDAFLGNELENIIIHGKNSLDDFEDASGLTPFEDIITFKP